MMWVRIGHMMRWAYPLVATCSVAVAARAGQPAPPPSDSECRPLPPARMPLSFAAGEVLEFQLDAMGIARAGSVTMQVLPPRDGKLPIQLKAHTNTLFSKVRRMKGLATSYLDAVTLHPVRYVEEGTENEVRKTTSVSFRPKQRRVEVDYKIGDSTGQSEFQSAHDALDVAATVYLMRQLPLEKGTELCFDIYGIRRLWRMSGKVEGREHVSLAIGDFEAWHLAGTAVRLDDFRHRREVHLWISDDRRRLPLAMVGAIEVGAVRAQLTGVSRPGEKALRVEGRETLKW